MSGEGEVLSIEGYMAQGFTRVQAIKKHYEALKQHGGPTSQTTAAETNREQLQKRYEEIHKLNEQKGFVKTAIRSVNVERRLSQRLGDLTFEDNGEPPDEEEVIEDTKQHVEPPKVEEPNRSINTQAPRAPSPVNAPSSTRSVESKLFQALEDVESRSGLSKLSSARDILSADTIDDEYSDDDEDDEDEDDPFPHFVDTTSVDPDDVKAPVKIELQSSEPTMDNISSFIHQSDYSEDEVKEFHFLIDQGFNIDEASDLVYQRRLNADNDEPPAGATPPPSSSNKVPGAVTPPPPPSYETAVSSPSPTSMMGGGNTIFSAGSLSPPPSYTAAMAMAQPLHHQQHQQQQQHHNFLQPPPPYNQRIGSRSPLMHHPQQQQQQPPFHHPQHMHQRMAPVPTQIKRIPLRANALSGNKEADLRQLLERGYTFEQATEICDIIYAERMAEEEEQQRQQQGFDPRGGAGQHSGHLMSVAGSSMASGGLKKKRSGRKANNNRKMMQDFQQLSSNHYPDVEALKLALLVSEQEAEYGVNMYDSLQPEDEDIIADYMSQGYTLDEAVFEVFTSKMGNVSNNKVRQLSGSGNGPSGALRSLMTANTGNGMSGSGSPNPRNLLIPVRETPNGSRDSPTIQMTGGAGGGMGTGSSTPVNNSSNNSNRNSFVGGNTGPSQPTPTRMTQPVRIPANSPAMMAPGIQQSFMPNQNSPTSAQGGNMHSMMRKAGIPGISTPPVVQLAQSPAAGGPLMFPGAPMDDHGVVDASNMMVDHGHHVDFDEMDEMGDMMLGPNGEMIDMNMMMDMMMMPPNAAAAAFDVDYTAAKNIENEIELLMMTGYTRESAVRFLLEKAKRETPAIPMPRSRMNSGRMVGPPPLPPMVEDDMPLPVPTEIKDSDHMTVTSDLTGSVIMSVASSQRNKAREQSGYSEYMSPRELPPPSSSHLKYYGNDGLYQPMAGAYPSGNVHGGYGGGNNTNTNPNTNNHLMHQINEADNEDEEYDDYVEEAAIDLKHMYPYMGYEGIYNRQPHRNIFNLYEEERALKVGILISQQSATFDTNMYESITPEDEPMINSLLALGFDEDETYLIIFERKFGPPGIGERSVRSIPSQPSSSKKHMMRHGDVEIDNASTESMRRILHMSRHEHEQKPGAVKMPGYQSSANAAGGGNNNANSSNNNNSNSSSNNNNHHHHHQGNGGGGGGGGNVDYSDINPRNMEVLVSMGFTVEEVAHALRVNAYDLHGAAQYLLGGA